MDTVRIRPGPAADHAFRLGLAAGAALGLALVGLLYWTDVINLFLVGYALLVLFPVYLVFVAAVLSRWLRFDKDVSDLRPVYRTRGPK